MSESTKVAIIGAGKVGGALGVNLARHGVPVRFGVRRDADLNALLAACEGRAQATPVVEAVAWADMVVLAVPAAAALDSVREAAGVLKGKVLVDATNPVGFGADGPVLRPPEEGSVAAQLAKALPGVRVVKAFNTFGAEFHGDPKLGGSSVDVYIAGDDAQARVQVAALATRTGFTAVDSGPLRNAALLEAMAVLWIHLALKGGQGREVAFKLLRRG